jgi:subtilisin family serine protease
VARVEQDATVPLADVQNGADWGVDRIDQRALPLNHQYAYNGSGAGATVYIVDTGIRMSHIEFGGRAIPGYSSINDGRGGNDCSGHGTHVAGIIGSRRYGVAKAARLVSVRVYDCNGLGTMSGLLGGIDWVTKNAQRPAVANMSLGGTYSATLNQAVQTSIDAGITYVVSAGNYSKDACTISPASVGAAITVGATTPSDDQASFSDYGPCVDLYAPGLSILSTYNTGDTASYWLSGTSMSAPFVAGAAAVYLASHATARPGGRRCGADQRSEPWHADEAGPRVAEPPPLHRNWRLGSSDVAIHIDSEPPVASFGVQCAKARCTFDASASTDDHGIVSYSWDFGDGGSADVGTAATIRYTYQRAGTYTITLTVATVPPERLGRARRHSPPTLRDSSPPRAAVPASSAHHGHT